jgi:hypothetical protein
MRKGAKLLRNIFAASRLCVKLNIDNLLCWRYQLHKGYNAAGFV